MNQQSAYPLAWPENYPRTPAHLRERGVFDGTPDRVRTEMLMEIDRIALGNSAARTRTVREYVVISTNVPLRRDGEPRADVRPPDPGVAVYFQRKGEDVCLACDKYDAVWKNMRAIQKTIEALRGIERWGSSALLERAFRGFAALPHKTGPTCFEVLGIDGAATEAEILEAYRQKAKTAHPDQGGSVEAFQEAVEAKDNALAIKRGRTGA